MTLQLEEMHEKKGEFGHEFRIVTAGWYMMLLPHPHPLWDPTSPRAMMTWHDDVA